MRFRKALTFLILGTALVFALSGWAQQKTFTQEQVSNMVRAGLGDGSGGRGLSHSSVCDLDSRSQRFRKP